MNTARQVNLRIDRLVVETDRPVDGFTFQLALGTALERLIRERGVPAAWSHDQSLASSTIYGSAWDGLSGAAALARVVAERLYEEAVR